ncbi:MAG: hypothetical protein Q9176_001681 [Flavoplaca citrina]
MLNEWFINRRGLALGILCAATGVSGLFYPFVLETLLSRHPNSYHDATPKIDYSFFKMPLFYIFSLAALLEGLGHYFPKTYLPSYATSFGLSDPIRA